MRALLEIKLGESLYKMAVSEWLRDSDGAVIFKVISKRRSDGQIELVYYTQRGDGRKRVMQDIIIAEADFWRAMDLIGESLKGFFPEIKFRVENIDLNDRGQNTTAPATKWGARRLLFMSWLKCQAMALKTLWVKK